MLSSLFNITWQNSSYQKIIKDDAFTKHVSSFTTVQRVIFILSTIVLFWILFIIIYLSSRLIIRFISNLKRSHFNLSSSSSTLNATVCQAFVISSNQYGSFRPIQSFDCIDSRFPNNNSTLTNKQITTFANNEIMHLTINENFLYQQSKTNLLEHYLKTYNPLQIDLTDTNKETMTVSNNKNTSYEELTSETDSHPLDSCYPLNCTNKQKLYQTKRYTRLQEQENSSATIIVTDDRLSECSTKLTTMILPVVMITDCSDSQRPHTDIIEMNEEE